MPLAHQSQHLARQKVDASQQEQRSVSDVLMVPPYGGVFSWYRRQIRSGILDGLHAKLFIVGQHGH